MVYKILRKIYNALFPRQVITNINLLTDDAPLELPDSSDFTFLNLSAAADDSTFPNSEIVEANEAPALTPDTPYFSEKLYTGAGTNGVEVIDLSGGGVFTALERKPDVRRLRNYAKHSTWVRAAIDYKREKIGRARVEIVPVDSTVKPTRTDKRVRAEIEKLLRTPNAVGDSYGLLKEKILEDYYVVGHGAFELDLYNDTTIHSIETLDAETLGFNRNWTGKDAAKPRYAEFDLKTGRIRRWFASEQVMCLLNRPFTFSNLGVSHLEVLHQQVVGLLSGDELLIRRILQPVSEKLISLGEGVTSQQANQFKFELQNVRHKLAVISGAKDPKVLDLAGTPEEMKILDGCEWFVRQVAAVFNISTAKLKLSVDTSRANTSEMMADDLEALEGDLNRLIELENSCFINRYSYLGDINLQFSYPIMHRRDERQQAQIAKLQMGQQGWAAMNETRTRTGEKPLKLEYADEPIINTDAGPLPYSIWVKTVQEYEKQIGKTPEATSAGNPVEVDLAESGQPSAEQ